jgi:uncharacterized protein YgiM (DUF1202 family)
MTGLCSKITIAVLMNLFLGGVVALAQEPTCPEIVQAALDATDEQCSSTGRNQACYGNVNLEATPQPNVADFNFSTPGDIVAVSAVESLSLSSRVEDVGEWGVALMQLQANIPDTTPGQNVTFLLFGDVEIENRVETNVEPITFEVTAQGNINVRSGPSTDDAPVTGLSGGDTVTAVSRNAESTWLQVSLSGGITGWVAADVVTAEDDISLLNVISIPALTPMQAFFFKSGIGDAPCAEAPDSGILVQTPEGVTQVEFTVNDVNIVLGSTAYLQAQPGSDMTTSVVEGEATVTSGGATIVVSEGSQVRVPLDANGQAAGAPSQPEPYDGAKMALLPIRILPRTITIAAPIEITGGIIPTAGEWQWATGEPSEEGCPGGLADLAAIGFTTETPFQLSGDEFGVEMLFVAAFGQVYLPNAVFTKPDPNTYVAEFTDGAAIVRYTVRVVDADHIEAELGYSVEECAYAIPFEVTRIGESTDATTPGGGAVSPGG